MIVTIIHIINIRPVLFALLSNCTSAVNLGFNSFVLLVESYLYLLSLFYYYYYIQYKGSMIKNKYNQILLLTDTKNFVFLVQVSRYRNSMFKIVYRKLCLYLSYFIHVLKWLLQYGCGDGLFSIKKIKTYNYSLKSYFLSGSDQKFMIVFNRYIPDLDILLYAMKKIQYPVSNWRYFKVQFWSQTTKGHFLV